MTMFFSADLLQEMTSLWFQAPMVMSARLSDLTASGATGFSDNGAEVARMVSEKFSATIESVLAVNTAVVKESVVAAATLATGTCAGLAGSYDRIAVAALKPYGKRVRANARRLAK